jgi:hypothetical protein
MKGAPLTTGAGAATPPGQHGAGHGGAQQGGGGQQGGAELIAGAGTQQCLWQQQPLASSAATRANPPQIWRSLMESLLSSRGHRGGTPGGPLFAR